jgi:Spy/CpxP family protein refolding chaperone
MGRIAEELNLTDQQKEKTKAIFQEEGRKLRQLRQDKELSREDKMAKVREIRRSIEGELKPILTAEQWEKWQKVRADFQKERRARTQQKESAPAEKEKTQ